MTDSSYNTTMSTGEEPRPRPLILLRGEVKTPPLSAAARREVGGLLRTLQNGGLLAMPVSRPMPSVGPRCHELRVNDENQTWRVVYRIDPDAIVVADVFGKKTRQTPKPVIDACRRRLAAYDRS